MDLRTFGRTGWRVGEVGYGMWGTGRWTGSDDDESMASLERAVHLGCNFFDTAWAYGQGTLKAEGLVRAVGISVNRWEAENGLEALRTGVIDAGTRSAACGTFLRCL